jgi:hypothetical protein
MLIFATAGVVIVLRTPASLKEQMAHLIFGALNHSLALR